MIVRRIADKVTCDTCAVELRRVATLSPPTDHAAFVRIPIPGVARNRGHQYFVGPMLGDSTIGVFDADGDYIHGYGRTGDGPEEFRGAPYPLLLRMSESDMLFAIEGNYLRALDSPLTGTISKTQLRVVPSDALILGETVVVQWPVQGGEGQATPIQVLADDGTIARGIGAVPDRPMSREAQFDRFRKIARGHEGDRIWSAYVSRYELSLFTLTGHEELRVSREADWFEEYDDPLPGEVFLVPSRPRVEGLLERPGGLLWVVVSHADKSFQGVPDRPRGEVPIDPDADFNRLLDTTIELLDVTNGEVVVRQTFDEHLRFVSTADDDVVLYAMRDLENGQLVCDIFEPVLKK